MMYSRDEVDERIAELKAAGLAKDDVVRGFVRMTVGWPYVFGAWGETCTPDSRRKRARDDHPTIVSACQVLNGNRSDCDGCKWYLPVRMYDCRGFTHWVFEQVGITIRGGGCTSQWNDGGNWVIQGPIEEMPRDWMCCVFTGTEKKKEHTGVYLGDGATIECSSGVQYFEKMKAKWKYYAVPAGLYEDVPVPEPGTDKPTLRRGDKGPYVTLAQTELKNRGYDLGKCGVDGDFGRATEAAVKAFQRDHGLAADGIVGPKTWEALDSAAPVIYYTVTVPHLTEKQAEGLCLEWNGATMREE